MKTISRKGAGNIARLWGSPQNSPDWITETVKGNGSS
jgi:hypothetical protein